MTPVDPVVVARAPKRSELVVGFRNQASATTRGAGMVLAATADASTRRGVSQWSTCARRGRAPWRNSLVKRLAKASCQTTCCPANFGDWKPTSRPSSTSLTATRSPSSASRSTMSSATASRSLNSWAKPPMSTSFTRFGAHPLRVWTSSSLCFPRILALPCSTRRWSKHGRFRRPQRLILRASAGQTAAVSRKCLTISKNSSTSSDTNMASGPSGATLMKGDS